MGKELSTQTVSAGYPALSETNRERTKEIYEELFPDGINARDMERIRMHPDKSPTFLSHLKDPDTEKGDEELRFIVLGAHRNIRVMFETNEKLPVCTSTDGVHGNGKYADQCGSICARCPMAQFGSHKEGRGQACSQKIVIPILKRGSIPPSLLVLPATSIKNYLNYKAGLGYSADNARLPREIETVAKVVKTKGTAHSYNQVVFALANDLEAEQIQTVKDLNLMLASKPSNFDGVVSPEDPIDE